SKPKEKKPKQKKSKKKLIIVLVGLLVVVGAAYKLVLAPKKADAKSKISGALVTLDPEFIVNLAGGHYAKITVALLVPKAPTATTDGAAPQLHQNAAVRAVITDTLTGLDESDFVSRGPRHRLLVKLVKALDDVTDESIKRVFLTDISIQ